MPSFTWKIILGDTELTKMKILIDFFLFITNEFIFHASEFILNTNIKNSKTQNYISCVFPQVLQKLIFDKESNEQVFIS